METNPVERSRSAIIGGVLTQLHAANHINMTILDVGCGEGAIVDFLPPSHTSLYVGVDLSSEAIKLAQQKRGSLSSFRSNIIQFVSSSAHEYEPSSPHQTFDVIIFSEVLYYTEYETIINQYNDYLSKPNGIMIISVYRTGDRLFPKMAAIFEYAREKFQHIDTIDIDGFISRKEKEGREKTGFHIEVFELKV